MIKWPVDILDNKYRKWYEQIVTRAQSRILPEGTYVERHHIVPRSFNGSNCKSNIAVLTAREHFICHWLLVKMTTGEQLSKMYWALNCMRRKGNHQLRYESYITSRVYEQIKPIIREQHLKMITGRVPTESHRKKMSEALKGRKQTDEHRRNSSLARKGKPGHKWTEDQKKKFLKRIEEFGGAMLGKTHSNEAKKKMSKAQKERMTPEERAIRSERSRGANNPMYGRKQTEEAKKKMSRLGWKHSEETKAKMRETRAGQNTGRKLSEETKKKISESRLAGLASGKVVPWNKGKTDKK